MLSSALRLGSRQLAFRTAPKAFTAGPSRILPLVHQHILTTRSFHPTPPALVTLNQSCRRKRNARRVKKGASPLLNNAPQRKGVCIQVFTAKPKKPNSGKRKVARVKLSTGKTCQAYISGEGHNLQEHSVVLVRGGKTQDLPGVKYKVVRGALDLGGVVNRGRARSRYGVKKPKK
uniref:Ribosomal protein S12 n=1 Tax=Mycena chlorophos TaxID=658473 RepID=A0ABQ0M6B3_MYCCL|nr:predicted protein [Mycena chlorophos]